MKEKEVIEWIYNFERQPRIDDNGSSLIYINWVNLEHKYPFFGVDIVDWSIDFKEYEMSTGRIVFRWAEQKEMNLFLPDEVVDKETLFEYLEVIKPRPFSNNY